MSKKPKFYAVKAGHVTGIFTDWSAAQKQVNGYRGAQHAAFKTRKEAEVYMGMRERPVENVDDEIIIYTDGSYSEECGGYAFIVLQYNEVIAEAYGKVTCSPCTNNRAELTAILKALEWLQENRRVDARAIIKSDSMYAIKALTTNLIKWKSNHFKTSKHQNVKNKNLILQCDALLVPYIRFEHVSGHSHQLYNTRVDTLANLGRVTE